MSSIRLLGFCSVVILISLFHVEAHEEDKAAANWPWEKPHVFKCPSPFGTFSDPDDCSSYFVCVGRIATRRSCKRMLLFDKNIKRCVSFIIAVCDNSGKETTTTRKPVVGTTPEEDTFTCPSLSGSFLHPTDCTKYYTCTFFIPFLKTCPDNELFDGVKKQCKPAKEVHCGARIKPTEPTTLAETTTPEVAIPTTTPTTVEETTTPTTVEETTTPITIEETTTPTTIEETTTPTTIEETTTPTTTQPPIPTTTTKPRVTAPDTTCDLDDLDCIIDDLGETPYWFVCDSDMGSYPHPTSTKLFIFCMNWRPSVKKCGQDLVFSEDLMTCVSP